MANYTQYDEYTRGRQIVLKLLEENNHLSFTAMRQKLRQKNIMLKDQTIRNYMSQWRLYSRFGLVPRCHSGLGVLESGFDSDLWEHAPCLGWTVNDNRNRCRRICRQGVWLLWHRNGTVQFRFKGAVMRSVLMTAFSQAFYDVMRYGGKPECEIADYLRALFIEGYRGLQRHSTFETGLLLPKVDIQHFKKSHGMSIKLGDGSHPTAVEIEEMEPFWLSKFDKTLDRRSQEIENHLDLVTTWKDESEKRQQAFEILLQKLKKTCILKACQEATRP